MSILLHLQIEQNAENNRSSIPIYPMCALSPYNRQRYNRIPKIAQLYSSIIEMGANKLDF